jgi:hypothetical protein
MVSIPKNKEFLCFINLIKVGDLEGIRKMLRERSIWLSFSTRMAGNAQQAVLDCRINRDQILTLLVESGLKVSKTGLNAETMAIVRAALAKGPRWRRDAFEQEINEIYIVRSKAWGIYFNPGDLQYPLYYGGGYDGEYPVTAAYALERLDIDLRDERLKEITGYAKWFRPFLVKMVGEIDFPLDDVTSQISDKRNIRYLES